MIKPCFKVLYNPRTKECQCCELSIECSKNQKSFFSLSKKARNGKIIAVIQFLNSNPKSTTTTIKQELVRRFGEDSNVYYYLDILKKEGILDIMISGRQRYYSLR